MKTLVDYYPLMCALVESFASRTSFSCEPKLNDVLRNPRLIAVVNHAAPLSWLPVMGLLGKEFYEHGGAHRTPIGIADRWFYSNPLTQKLASFITQSENPQNFTELLENFSKSENCDLVLMPEGANTFFGDVHSIREFRSVKFVELAIRSQTPLLLVVHKGSESWSANIPIPEKWAELLAPFGGFFSKKIIQDKSINLILPPLKVKHFQMKCQLYMPALYESDLSEDKHQRQLQLNDEAENIRDIMNSMLSTLN